MAGVSAFEQRYGFSRDAVRLDNWRLAPFSAWAYQNVGELVPSAHVWGGSGGGETPEDASALLGETVSLPTAPFVHLFVARGAVDLEAAGPLATGDAARITASDGRRVTAVGGPAEVLVWEMHAQLG